ncbi:MAG: trypsin-like peptidase domain-containing protein [Xanthobacteraceae bacterium]
MIPDDNLAYPVLVILKNKSGATLGFGSGIYFGTANAEYLVTAKHVIASGLPNEKTGQAQVPDLVLELVSYSKDLPTPQRILLRVDFKMLLDRGDVKPHKLRDVAVVKIGTLKEAQDHSLTTFFSPGVTKVEFADSGLVSAGMIAVRKFDEVLVGNDAILYGYPASLGLPESPQFDPLRPLLRRALIAGKDPQRHSLIIDGPVYRGNSGGPVFEIDPQPPDIYFHLVGIMIEFIPLTERAPDFTMLLNSGYSIAEPMDFVLELIQ